MRRSERAAARDAFVTRVDANDLRGAEARQTQVEQLTDRTLTDDGHRGTDEAGQSAERRKNRRHRLREDGLVIRQLWIQQNEPVVGNGQVLEKPAKTEGHGEHAIADPERRSRAVDHPADDLVQREADRQRVALLRLAEVWDVGT